MSPLSLVATVPTPVSMVEAGDASPFDVDIDVLRPILTALQRQRSVLAIARDGKTLAGVTTVLAVTDEALVLDCPSDPRVTQQLLAGSPLHLQGRDRDIPVAFTVAAPTLAEFEGSAALVTAVPLFGQRFQRREYFRARIPLGRAAHCIVSSQQGEPATTRLVDVSCGGVGLAGEAIASSWPLGEMRCGSLYRVPALEGMSVELQAVRVTRVVGHEQHLGCRFVRLPPAEAQRLQRYVTELERDLRKLV